MAHLMRDLKYFSETLKDEWSSKIKKVFEEAVKLKRSMLSTDYDIENEAIQNIENSLNQLLEEGYILSKDVKAFKKRLIKTEIICLNF